ncbi:unnamed protein product [Vitrella brassicaformis CCMP3155]|uniref:Ankyrin repeat protein n=1 Tax=Vitrella brassicaformis (strain CCMP3155) TaxID=1169540 RepID=A0A0G4EJK9_VITBC|nr:unnamed protein product [Vitrella brassicaformis CCMP3155]|eukprot:CEL96941.1 unnamed protein product [Vitrella brassicaformis CCMP3155]
MADEYEVVEALFKAAEKGECASVTQMIKTHGVAILDKRNDSGNTPFLAALDEVGAMQVMYDAYGPSILKQTDKLGRTAMHEAALLGKLAAVNQLLEWDPKLIDARDITDTAKRRTLTHRPLRAA